MDKMMVLKLLMLMFPAVIFLQAGLDKLFNMKSNAQYIQSVFEKTVLSGQAVLLFVVLVILELASGLNAMAGAVLLYISGDASLGYVAMVLSCITLLCLLAGQRIAKDYAGAAGIVPYLAVSFLGLYLFAI
jgi:uncharacterized membrane protein YphA (DoxX/SURF4 family)